MSSDVVKFRKMQNGEYRVVWNRDRVGYIARHPDGGWASMVFVAQSSKLLRAIADELDRLNKEGAGK